MQFPIKIIMKNTKAMFQMSPVRRNPRSALGALSALCALGIPVSHGAILAVNFSHGDFPSSTGIGSGESTEALDAVADLDSPSWYNLAVSGSGSIANGRSSATFDGVGVSVYAANGFAAGSQNVVLGDASQQVFRYYLDDGDGGNGYFNGDGIGASIHLTGLQDFLAANSATSYRLTLFFNGDATANDFPDASVREGIAGTPSATAISSLNLIGSVEDTFLGNGQAPLDNLAAGGGTRAWGDLSGLTADNLVISMPSWSSGSPRASISGFTLTPVPEPSIAILASLGVLGLFRRRRPGSCLRS